MCEKAITKIEVYKKESILYFKSANNSKTNFLKLYV